MPRQAISLAKMIAKSYIRKNLTFYNKKYLSSGKLEALVYSKIAILELCGWIELSMDDMVRTCAKKNLKSAPYLKHVEKQIIWKTWGFDYEADFKDMIVRLVGLIVFEKIESKLTSSDLQKFKAALGTLKTIRNSEGHTYLKGLTRNIIAPSATMALHKDVEKGLLEFEKRLLRYKA